MRGLKPTPSTLTAPLPLALAGSLFSRSLNMQPQLMSCVVAQWLLLHPQDALHLRTVVPAPSS